MSRDVAFSDAAGGGTGSFAPLDYSIRQPAWRIPANVLWRGGLPFSLNLPHLTPWSQRAILIQSKTYAFDMCLNSKIQKTGLPFGSPASLHLLRSRSRRGTQVGGRRLCAPTSPWVCLFDGRNSPSLLSRIFRLLQVWRMLSCFVKPLLHLVVVKFGRACRCATPPSSPRRTIGVVGSGRQGPPLRVTRQT